jgi:soluble lytic murein transglycosylase-like protein
MKTWPRTISTAAAGVLGLVALALSTASPGEALPLGSQPDAAPPAREAVPAKLISADDAADDAATAEAPPTSDPVAHWRPYSEEASRRFGVPLAWIERVIRAESGGRTTLAGRPIVSRAGAMGLMQLMPRAWADMRVSYGLGPDPFEPRDNILAGTAYLAAMYRRFGYPGLFGAYNAGPARYKAWLAGRGALPSETQVYLARLTGDGAPATALRHDAGRAANRDTQVAVAVSKAPDRARLFAVDRSAAALAAPSIESEGQERHRNGLFVALSRAASSAAGD